MYMLRERLNDLTREVFRSEPRKSSLEAYSVPHLQMASEQVKIYLCTL